MFLRLLECAAGLVLAWLTLRDVFATVVVPGRSHGALRVSQRYARGALPVWHRLLRRPVGTAFAPGVLVASFASWMLLLVLAFALMAHALRDSFEPPLPGFGAALYVAGSSMTTIGFGTTEAHDGAAWVTVGAGLCGLAVMTLAVTYLLEVQSNIGQRDTGVLKLTTTAGEPPSGVTLLEHYGALGCQTELAEVLRQGRDWCAHTLQSHVSHPSLIYFRSAGTGTGWPTALGALLDAALVLEFLLDVPGTRGPAVLLRRQAQRLSVDVCGLLEQQARPSEVAAAQLDQLCAALVAAGYTLRDDADRVAFIAAREIDVGLVDALSHHLGMPPTPLLP